MNKQLIYVNCDFCGSNDYKFYDELEGFVIVKCSSCGFCYTNPRPDMLAMKDYYVANYFRSERFGYDYYTENGKLKVYPIASAGLGMIEHYVNSRGTILEIGAAHGHLLAQLRKTGWDVEGVEISQDAVNAAMEIYGLELFCGQLSAYVTEKKFDVICLNQTLEHLPDPRYVIERCRELLKEKGLMIISVPNLKAFDIKVCSERKRLSYDLPRHLNHFYPSFLKRVLKKEGFKILEVDRYYPAFVIRFINWINSNKKINNNIPDQQLLKEEGKIPLLKKQRTVTGSALKILSRFLPGWRFTIIARK